MSNQWRTFLSATVMAWVIPGGTNHAHQLNGAGVSQAPTIKVHADLAVLHVAVLDGQSRFVPGLPPDYFKIYEDGVPQTIRFFSNEDRAATIGLLVDNSGSMYSKRNDVIAAGLAFAKASNPLDEFFVVHFNERVWLTPEGTSFTSDPLILAKALSQ